MEIELQNGEKLILEVSSLLLEYLEDYPGGVEQLEKDANEDSKLMYVTNHLVYSMIASNYDKQLTYRQAVKLVKLDDIEKIIDFIIKNTPNLENKLINRETNIHRF